MEKREVIMTRLVPLKEAGIEFDQEFWAKLGPEARLAQVWPLTLEIFGIAGYDVDQPRLQRSVCLLEHR